MVFVHVLSILGRMSYSSSSYGMGCSPYFAVTGTHPLLPFDILEANYLLPPPESVLTTTELIIRRAIALQKRRPQLAELHAKVFDARRKAALIFERDHAHTIREYDFKLGNLVLIRNTVELARGEMAMVLSWSRARTMHKEARKDDD